MGKRSVVLGAAVALVAPVVGANLVCHLPGHHRSGSGRHRPGHAGRLPTRWRLGVLLRRTSTASFHVGWLGARHCESQVAKLGPMS
jgi:hypothetical protein